MYREQNSTFVVELSCLGFLKFNVFFVASCGWVMSVVIA